MNIETSVSNLSTRIQPFTSQWLLPTFVGGSALPTAKGRLSQSRQAQAILQDQYGILATHIIICALPIDDGTRSLTGISNISIRKQEMPKAIFYVLAVCGTAFVSACSTTDAPEAPERQSTDRKSKEDVVLECAAKAGIGSSFPVTKGFAGGSYGYAVTPSKTITDQQAADANDCIRLGGAGLPRI
ncbi:MAG: hypothetical protein AB3N19_10990 [Ruegeria sp.]